MRMERLIDVQGLHILDRNMRMNAFFVEDCWYIGLFDTRRRFELG